MKALASSMTLPGFGSLPAGLTVAEYGARGARAAIISNALGIAAIVAQRNVLTILRDTGNVDAWFKEQAGANEAAAFFDAVGMDDV